MPTQVFTEALFTILRVWEQEEKGTTEDEMAGWQHRLMSLSKLWEAPKNGEVWRAAVHGVAKS